MKKSLIIFYSFITVGLFAQDVVTDTDWEMDPTGTKVVITYNLNKLGPYRFFDIKLYGVVDGIEFPAKSVSGDVGTYIRVGRNKTIFWEIFKDIAEDPGTSLSVRVVATNSAGNDLGIENTPEPVKVGNQINTVPVWAGLGGVVSLGGGLIVGGVSKLSNAKSDNDSYLGLTTNQEYNQYLSDFDDINKRYKSGQWLMAGGAVVMVAGGYILIRRLIDMKKIKNRISRINVKPQIELQQVNSINQPSSYAGIKLSYTF